MKKLAVLAFALLVVGVVNSARPNVQALNFVTLSGRALGSDGQPIVNAKIFSDETNGVNRVITCTNTDGSWSLEVPVNSAQRSVYIWLTPIANGDSNVDCSANTSGSIPSLRCWAEVGPFVAASNTTVNFNIAALQTRTLRIIDADGFPFYGARIGTPNSFDGYEGPCPVSSPQVPTIRSFMHDGGDGDTDMDGLIAVMGPTPFGKNIKISIPNVSATVVVNLTATDQIVELPFRQSLPRVPTVSVGSTDDGNPQISVVANSADVGLSKFTVKLSDGSLVCTIMLQSNAKNGFCTMNDWIRGGIYDFVTSSWNGKGEGSSTSVKHTMPGWNTTSTPAPAPSTPTLTTPIVTTPKVSTPTLTTPIVTTPKVSTPTLTTPKAGTPRVTMSKAASVRSIALYAKLNASPTSKITLKVVSRSAKYCKVSGSTLKGLKTGSCKVTVIVTPKKGRATSKTLTLKVAA